MYIRNCDITCLSDISYPIIRSYLAKYFFYSFDTFQNTKFSLDILLLVAISVWQHFLLFWFFISICSLLPNLIQMNQQNRIRSTSRYNCKVCALNLSCTSTWNYHIRPQRQLIINTHMDSWHHNSYCHCCFIILACLRV